MIKIRRAVLRLHPCPNYRRRAALTHRIFIKAAAGAVPDSGWHDCGDAGSMDVEEKEDILNFLEFFQTTR
ncbi:MAG: hypothetical protein EPN24_07535 [Candidatus Methanoperedens sp.]|nr:MAG: hypothetical protein EPN24_07535 [Candidatus Methanoperedens sp.]